MKRSSRRRFLKNSAALVAGGTLLNSHPPDVMAAAPSPSAMGAFQQSGPAAPDRLTVHVNTQQTGEPVSKYQFGMFIEELGTLVHRSLWSEMLDDRKFYFPISSKEAHAPAGAPGAFRRMELRKWRPVGPEDAVIMDKSDPFVGDQSPRVQLDGAEPRGIRQTGLALVNGKEYSGRIYLRATPGASVKVSLIWGKGANERQTLSFAHLSDEYRKFPLNFTANADTSDATFEITGTGSGSLYIGTVSLMPADNVHGFRPEIIALLRQIHSGFWRLPGGNFLSDWTWYDATGDPDKRPPMFDHAWNAMQTNDVGLDEFMTFCKLIGVEPYITVNAGFGDAHSAAEEVEYINGAVTTRLGALRAQNGHPEPYGVKFWNIGNEPWGTFQLGYTPLKYYVLKHNEFAKRMREVDPSITLIASGKMLIDMFLKGEQRIEYTGNLQPLYGTDVDWTGGLLAHCWGNFDGIAEHWYARGGVHFDMALAKTLPPDAPTDDAFVPVEQTPVEFARYGANVVRRKAEEWQGYQRRFPAMLQKKIFLSIDEYAYSEGQFNRGPNLKLTLAYAMIFNEMMRHTDFLTMSAHTMGVSTLDYTSTAATLNATGLLYKLYCDHFLGTIPLALSGNSPQPAPKYPIGGDQPRTTSGSPTYPLDMFAALAPDGKHLTLAVVNATDSQQHFNLEVAGGRPAGPSTLWRLSGESLEAVNRVGAPPQVAVKQIPLESASEAISVAPYSANVFRFPLSQPRR